jgi:hypothetical protein
VYEQRQGVLPRAERSTDPAAFVRIDQIPFAYFKLAAKLVADTRERNERIRSRPPPAGRLVRRATIRRQIAEQMATKTPPHRGD